MVEFFILISLSSLFSWLFLWIGISWLAIFPIAIVLWYSISLLWSFSLPLATKTVFKDNSTIIAWSLVLIWLIILLINRWIVRYHVTIITTVFNILLYYSSYRWSYSEWKSIFSRWVIITQVMGIIYTIRTQDYENISYIVSGWSIILLGMYYSIPLLFVLNQEDNNIIIQQQELSLYSCIYILLYWIFEPNYNAVIVSQLRCTSFLIAIRQSYLTTKDTILSKKKDWLSGRAILSWQKVLERYDHNTRSFSIDIFTSLINHGYMPSEYGMKILQYIQLISICLLVIMSIYWIIHDTWYILLRYRLWILCFIITLFGVQSQEKFIQYYKPLILTLITGAYYITLFDTTSSHSVFTLCSLGRLCINMIVCLFYKELFPVTESLFTRKDILYRLSMITISSILSILSLIRLPLSGDILFALGCIIIGLVSFFSYHIWRKR
jgi:hypothetical protein